MEEAEREDDQGEGQGGERGERGEMIAAVGCELSSAADPLRISKEGAEQVLRSYVAKQAREQLKAVFSILKAAAQHSSE